MDELLKKIYEEVLCYEQDILEAGQKKDIEINQLVEVYKEQLDEKTLEIVKTLMYQISLSSEQTGFWLGVKYAIKFFLDMLN